MPVSQELVHDVAQLGFSNVIVDKNEVRLEMRKAVGHRLKIECDTNVFFPVDLFNVIKDPAQFDWIIPNDQQL
jgi:hypothetical protein